ncbi:MAG: hydroxyethylthiazole kinase, partial [Gammaproteobacteria bacterium]
MADDPSASRLWDDVIAVRQGHPLVHSITNLVVINFNANALLAAGASPVMAHAHEEVREMTGIAQALVLNLGTLDPYWVEAMRLASQAAAGRGIPVVLDPVGAGATPYRDRAIAELLATAGPAVVRGNASEIISAAGGQGGARGVDSGADADEALQSARALARRIGGVVCVTGATDHVF